MKPLELFLDVTKFQACTCIASWREGHLHSDQKKKDALTDVSINSFEYFWVFLQYLKEAG